MLKDILEEKKGFKLVCGAGNEDIKEVEKLVYIYSLAGCNFFDVCAKKEVVEAAKRGLEKAGIKKDRYLCISVGIAGDPHISKAQINDNECIKCKKCISICTHNAINENCEIIKERCLGCGRCSEECPNNAIKMTNQIKEYDEFLPELISQNIDCIEFHAISQDEKDIIEKWEQVNSLFDGMLCISIDRSIFGDKKLKEIVQKMISKRKSYTTIIQADGVAMSGNNDEASTTLQAIATTQLFQNANLEAYIMMSGGTNIKSTKLAKEFNVRPNCLAVGSYARKIIKDYLLMDDLLENQKAIDEAVKIAKNLVDTSIENMKND